MTPQIARLLELVSPRTGVVRELFRVTRGVDEPSPPILYQAQLSSFDFKKAPAAERAAAGKGLTEDEAIGGAIGEAVERYCASHINPRRFQRCPAGPAAGRISPEECVLYSAAQRAQPGFPYAPITPDLELDFIAGRELPGDREVLVPASLVFLYGPSARPREYLAPPTSNGLAAGPDLPSAVVAGLCELVERDAFLITWMNRLPAPEVDLDALGGTAASIRDVHRRFGLETRVFDITTDIPIAAMMAVTVDRSGAGPAAVVGLGCHPDPARAALRALFEICQVRPGEARRHRETSGRRIERPSDVHTLEDHSAYFWPLDRLGELDFLLAGDRRRPLAEARVGSDLDSVAAAITGAGARVAYVDLTTRDVAPFGIRVVRAIAAGLQPIHFGHGEERLGGSRLLEVPARLGHARRELNPCPHPLA